ncbi:MAG: hypothetical protein ACLQVN_22995 [Bryobacteraceae bacterium]
MTIEIPDDLARGLKGVATEQNKTVEQLAVERLRALLGRPTSPGVLLQVIRTLPHPSASAVDDLDAAIAVSQLPMSDQGEFDAWQTE